MITPRVLVMIHDPVFENEQGRKLHELMGWNDPRVLAARYVDDVRQASHGFVNYDIVETLEFDEWPLKRDGFRYTDESYLRAWRARGGFHQPDAADYPTLLKRCDFVRKLEAGLVDELWMFAFPYGGYFESCMGGRGAIWCNGDIVPGTSNVSRRFCVMGFSYERGVGEMLENLGHRTENIMEHVFRDIPDAPAASGRRAVDGAQKTDGGGLLARLFGRKPSPVEPTSRHTPDLSGNLWRQFIRYDKTHPGAAQCGNVHFAPSSQSDYDWGNTAHVPTNADDWLNYPNFTGEVKIQNCAAWGDGDIRAHHIWWMQRFPHVEGITPTGLQNNWWKYICQMSF